MTNPAIDHAGPSAEIQRQVLSLGPWFHNLHLPSGLQTAPEHWLGDFPRRMWQGIAPHVPKDLRGWSALDIGCNAGFYSFELAGRGADVTGIDCAEQYLTQARWASQQYGLTGRIDFRRMQVYDLARSEATYDLVFFLGVFYHLLYPLLGLDIAARKARRRLVFQTMLLLEDDPPLSREDLPMESRSVLSQPGWAKMAYIERKLQGDPTNWWVPNVPAVEAMLRTCGMRVLARPGEGIFVCEPTAEFQTDVSPLNREQFAAATGTTSR